MEDEKITSGSGCGYGSDCGGGYGDGLSCIGLSSGGNTYGFGFGDSDGYGDEFGCGFYDSYGVYDDGYGYGDGSGCGFGYSSGHGFGECIVADDLIEDGG